MSTSWGKYISKIIQATMETLTALQTGVTNIKERLIMPLPGFGKHKAVSGSFPVERNSEQREDMKLYNRYL